MLMRTQPHLQPNIIGFRPTISWSISGSVFARPSVDDKPIIPVLSRRIMSVYDEKPEPAGGFIWAIIAGGRIWPTEYIVDDNVS